MFGLNRNGAVALMVLAATGMTGCVQTAGGGGGSPIGGGDGPTFVTDEKGCRYEVILGQRYPIVDAMGRPQCAPA
jgi:hypothetical protein